MSVKTIQTVSIIGAGNVAAHLGCALKKAGIRVLEICNRTPDSGRALARRTGARYIPGPAGLDPNADLVLISVSDDAVAGIAGKFRTRALVVHTSGSLGMDILSEASPRTGVLYPLQTFRKGRRLLTRNVPFCIEASTHHDETLLRALAMKLSGHVTVLDSERRKILHLSAVFASNFPNFLFSIADELLSDHDIPLKLLYPLVRQTAENVSRGEPFSLQTGPAIREDRKIMEIHRNLLKHHPEYRKIYDLISQTIIEQKRKHGKL